MTQAALSWHELHLRSPGSFWHNAYLPSEVWGVHCPCLVPEQMQHTRPKQSNLCSASTSCSRAALAAFGPTPTCLAKFVWCTVHDLCLCRYSRPDQSNAICAPPAEAEPQDPHMT